MRVTSKLLAPLLALAVVGIVVTTAAGSGARSSTIVPAPAFSSTDLNSYAGNDWLTSGGGLTDNRYSTLNQITTQNVGSLKVAWHSHFGLPKSESAKAFGEEATPVVYQGTVYVPDAFGDVFAFDGASGQELWKFADPRTGPLPLLATQRGLAIGDGRIYIGTIFDKAFGIDQTTGKTVWETTLGATSEGDTTTAAPLYYDGMVIFGVSGGDIGARGRVVALDASTGHKLWTWDVTPGPGQPGHDTWSGNEWLHSGSVWVYPSVDPQTGLLYVVTGNPVPWNGRGAGEDKWTDSIVALHVANGKFAWGFQTVHHDTWDYDVTNPPVLFDATYKGVVRHAIAVASKTGWVYILDRETGTPLIGIPEVKVPTFPAGSSEEKYANPSPTQPEPIGDALLNQCAKKSWWSGMAPDGNPYKVGCIFTPYAPTPKGSFTAFSPGASSIDWPPSSYDPGTKNLYVCANETHGMAIGAIPVSEQKLDVGKLYVGVNFANSKTKAADPGRLIAVDMQTNRIKWKDVFPAACYSGRERARLRRADRAARPDRVRRRLWEEALELDLARRIRDGPAGHLHGERQAVRPRRRRRRRLGGRAQRRDPGGQRLRVRPLVTRTVAAAGSDPPPRPLHQPSRSPRTCVLPPSPPQSSPLSPRSRSRGRPAPRARAIARRRRSRSP
jgi:alcohol dehydrogenase (cytochrome c)